MAHQAEHLDHVGSCHCFCEQCHEPTGLSACICEGCVCRRPAEPLHAAYYGDQAVAGDQDQREHVCEDCGRPVVRKGTRGRFPKRCPDCKAGQPAAADGLF